MTSVLGLKPGHDGSIAYIVDGRLIFSIEGEKDSYPRYSPVTAALVMEALRSVPEVPDVIALGGWYRVVPAQMVDVGAGYHGLDPGGFEEVKWFGQTSTCYSSSHERSHLYSGVALSPFDPDDDLAILVWEGTIGSFYRWRDRGRSITVHPVLDQPGARFTALYGLADPSFPPQGSFPPAEAAGKLMALAGLADGRPPSKDSRLVVASILGLRALHPFDKGRYRQSALFDCGVTDPEFCRAARLLSDEIFAAFQGAAEATFDRPLPLVITGGCGLNCEWNSAWDSSGLFSSVFVPPCANDSGSALGTAVDAWVQLGGSGHLEWDVYRGADFVRDADPEAHGWAASSLDHNRVAAALDEGAVVAWVQGRCEIGPRALGHRSLLASATRADSQDRLNYMKERETYRPVAPVCLEEELGVWFDREEPDPHMLRFRQVTRPDRLPSVTHADGSARAQSVSARTCPALHGLLVALRRRTGVGVACNTSLNFNGKGFINRTSELLHYCDWVGIDHAVIDDKLFRKDHGGRSLRSGTTTEP